MREKIKHWLKQSGWLTIKVPADPLIERFRSEFDWQERSFWYGWRKYLVQAIYCHASPGVIETTLNELSQRFKPGAKLLNLGGGIGQVSTLFSQLGYDVSNVDIALEKTDQKNLAWDLNQTPYPFANEQFDVIVAQEIIEHIENPWEFFRQARRILKTDGYFIVSTPNILSRFSRWQFLLTNYFSWFTPDCFDYHINPMPFWQIELVAKRTGFRIETLSGNGDYLFDLRNQTRKNVLNRNEEIIIVLRPTL